jgi:hypothetical protein
MNGKRLIILIIAVVLSALIVWHDLPIRFPWAINMLLLFLKLFIVLLVAGIAFIFAERKMKSS